MYPSAIEKLIQIFSKFPGIGPRTASRFAFYCLNADKVEINKLIDALSELKEKVDFCEICFRSILKENKICSICENKRRNHSLICVVEKEADLISIEKTGEYEGIYFILGRNVSPLRKEDFKKIRAGDLQKRIEKHEEFSLPKIKEIIIATNQNTEGEATAIYLERVLSKLDVKVSRLARGLSTGSELEYADQEPLSYALKGRK